MNKDCDCAYMLTALKSIAGMLTWNECATATPQVRLTKAEISNALDATIKFARIAVAKAEGLEVPSTKP